MGICHDLTDYKNALLKLHTAEQRYREIVESQTELIIRLDSNLRLTFINPAMCHFYKCEHSNQLLGTSFLELLHSDDRVLLKRQLIHQNGTPLEEVETLSIRMMPPVEIPAGLNGAFASCKTGSFWDPGNSRGLVLTSLKRYALKNKWRTRRHMTHSPGY